MTHRMFKAKSPENGISSPDHYLKSPHNKLTHKDIPAFSTVQDLRSSSKGKHRSKMHIFKPKNQGNQDQLAPPPTKMTLKSYSSLETLPKTEKK